MKKVCLFLVAFVAVNVLFSFNAHASGANALEVVMCNALSLVTGGTGRTLAAFAIVSLGIGFFLGKVAWGLMLAVALGIAALFGAPTIVNAIAGGDWNCDEITEKDVGNL